MLIDLFIFNSSRMSYATFIFHLCFLFNKNIRVVNGDVGKSFDFSSLIVATTIPVSTYKRATIGPPAKRHSNGVSLEGR